MTNLLALSFESHPIRFVGTAEKPEWVAADVIAVLYPEADKRNRRNYLAKVPTEWVGHKKIMTSVGNRNMDTIYEPGLYHLLVRSSSPLVVPFQKWLFEEVLPSIRKHGTYPPPAPPETTRQKALPASWVKDKDYQITDRKPDRVIAKHLPPNAKSVNIKTRAGMQAVIQYGREVHGLNSLTQSQMELLAIEMAQEENK